MKRLVVVALALVVPVSAHAFEQAMHLYLAHETFKNVYVGSEFYRHPPAAEIAAMTKLLKAFEYGCKGVLQTECKRVQDTIAKLSKQPPPAAPKPGVKVFLPFANKKPPFNAKTDGIMVSAPFEEALLGLGTQEFVRHFLAGVLGADAFPDFFSGGMSAHIDQSQTVLSTSSMFGLEWPKEIGAPKVDLWPSWKWGVLVFEKAQDKALFAKLADEWPADRPYWGKTYSKADLAKRLQHEAIAFAYGYWVHFAEDGVAHELVSAFSEGAYWFPNLVAGISQRAELRHSALEGYILEKMKPFMWRYAETLTDLKIPIPFVRAVLMEGEAVKRAPLAIHLLAFEKLKELYSFLFSKCPTSGTPKLQCGGKDAPEVYRTLNCLANAKECVLDAVGGKGAVLDCIKAQKGCFIETLCDAAKAGLGGLEARVRDAKDAWLLLSLAAAQRKAQDAIHPFVREGSPSAPPPPTMREIYVKLMGGYGFADQAKAGFKAVKGDFFEVWDFDALQVYADQFLIPAVLPIRIRFSSDGQPLPLDLEPAFGAQIGLSCAQAGFTNLVSVCELARKIVIDAAIYLFDKARAQIEQMIDVFKIAFRTYDPFIQKAKDVATTIFGSSNASSATPPKPKTDGATGPTCGSAFSLSDQQLNRVFPCALGSPCANGDFAAGPAAENVVSREIKARLERVAGLEALQTLTTTLGKEWASCKTQPDCGATITGEKRGACFSWAIWWAIQGFTDGGGKIDATYEPPHASAWLRRAVNMTALAIVSGPSLKQLVDGAPSPFSEKAKCAALVTAKPHILNGVQASLVGVNRFPKPKLENRHFDELSYGKFALYDKACAPLYSAILPEIADSDGDGVNDIYDTCPKVAQNVCKGGFDINPGGDHVGANCLASAPQAAKEYCVSESAATGDAAKPKDVKPKSGPKSPSPKGAGGKTIDVSKTPGLPPGAGVIKK